MSGKTLEVALQFLADALEETVVLPGRRKSGGQHVVAYDIKSTVSVEFAVSIGSALDIGIGRFLGASQDLNDDHHATDGERCEERHAQHTFANSRTTRARSTST